MLHSTVRVMTVAAAHSAGVGARIMLNRLPGGAQQRCGAKGEMRASNRQAQPREVLQLPRQSSLHTLSNALHEPLSTRPVSAAASWWWPINTALATEHGSNDCAERHSTIPPNLKRNYNFRMPARFWCPTSCDLVSTATTSHTVCWHDTCLNWSKSEQHTGGVGVVVMVTGDTARTTAVICVFLVACLTCFQPCTFCAVCQFRGFDAVTAGAGRWMWVAAVNNVVLTGCVASFVVCFHASPSCGGSPTVPDA